NVKIMLFGATMPTSCAPTGQFDYGEAHFTVYPEPGKDGIVAVCVSERIYYGKNTETRHFPAFLKVEWHGDKREKLRIDLEKVWIPAERIGQVKSDCIEVMVRGRRFCSTVN